MTVSTSIIITTASTSIIIMTASMSIIITTVSMSIIITTVSTSITIMTVSTSITIMTVSTSIITTITITITMQMTSLQAGARKRLKNILQRIYLLFLRSLKIPKNTVLFSGQKEWLKHRMALGYILITFRRSRISEKEVLLQSVSFAL